jgi:hypothetical protein
MLRLGKANLIMLAAKLRASDVAGGEASGVKRFPDFFIIGAPKCGTTTLYEWVSRHPQVYMPYKEPGFFSQDIYPTSHVVYNDPPHISSLEAYTAIFGNAAGANMMCGEATPRYMYSDQALAEIVRLSKTTKIIICLRDPVDLAISYHSQKIREGVEREESFEKCWLRSTEENTQVINTADHEIKGCINYNFWSRVGARLEKVFYHFPLEGSVKIILLDELKHQPQATYRSLLSFLGLPDDGRSEFKSFNERKQIRSVAMHFFALKIKRFMEPMIAPIRRYRGGRGLGFLKALNKTNTVEGKHYAQIENGFREEMYRTLQDDILTAEKYLEGRTLVVKNSA